MFVITDEMTEIAARAGYQCAKDSGDASLRLDWDELDPFTRRKYRRYYRAALEAFIEGAGLSGSPDVY